MKRVFQITGGLLLLMFLSVIVVNIIRPLFYKELDHEYKMAAEEKAYESEKISPERILCIDDNQEALIWRLRMIGCAEETVVLSTFDLRADNSGTDIMAALYDAAQRGVRVQLLIDGIYQIPQLKGNDTFGALISHENVEARFYNPVKGKNLYDLNYRMHDKYLIIDDRMYLLGGRNTNDIFLGDYQETVNVDREILVYETLPGEGESLEALRKYFAKIWDEPCVEEETARLSEAELASYDHMFRKHYEKLKETYGDFEEYGEWLEDTCEVNKITLVTNEIHDGNKEPRILHMVEQLALTGEDVLIQTPYIICNEEMYEVLAGIADVADLRIMINAVEKGSNPWGCTDYLNNKEKILETGASIYELMNEQAVHTKTILIDDNISIVGSYNLDMRSTYLDTEMMLVIDSEQLNTRIREMWEDYTEKSKEILANGTETEGIYYVPREMSLGKKISYTLLRAVIIPIRHLL